MLRPMGIMIVVETDILTAKRRERVVNARGAEPTIMAGLPDTDPVEQGHSDADHDRGDTTTNTMTYKGYAARIEYDDDDGIFTGQIAGIRDRVGFHANTVEDLREAFHETVEDYNETCTRIGKDPQKAFSGQVMFRVSPEVHRKAVIAAELAGKSLNQSAEEVLDRAAG
jgi:predicted HicB family RNase H-like nuclease